MGTKTEALEVIEILTEDQIKALPDSVKDNVVFLTENMAQKELMILNPLVSTLLQLRGKAEKLKAEKDKDGEFTKESIKEYKEVKSEQRSFNGTLSRTAKAMKDPINKVKDGIIAIEKTFKEESDKIKEDAELKFKEYEEQVAEKTRIAKEKKDAEMNAQITEANEETERLKLQQEKMNIYNAIRNVEINENISDKSSDAIDDSNEISLERLKAEIAQKTWEKLSEKHKIDKLDPEAQEELKGAFDKARHRAIKSIDVKLQDYEDAREKLKQEAIIPKPVTHTLSTENIQGLNNEEVISGVYPLSKEEFNNFILKEIQILKDTILKKLRMPEDNPELLEIYEKLNNQFKNL